MALDALEKEHLRRRMATRMSSFLQNAPQAECISAHWYPEDQACELCQRNHSVEMLVVKNRAGKTMKADVGCLKEMIRFQVADLIDFVRWTEKLPALKQEAEKRAEELRQQREEERRRLEKKVIVRKRV